MVQPMYEHHFGELTSKRPIHEPQRTSRISMCMHAPLDGQHYATRGVSLAESATVANRWHRYPQRRWLPRYLGGAARNQRRAVSMMVITTKPVGYRKDASMDKRKWVYRFSPPYRSLLPPRKDTYQRRLIQIRVAYCATNNSLIAGIALCLIA